MDVRATMQEPGGSTRILKLDGYLGDVAYASEPISLHPPFTISVAVWAEDPRQPLVSTDGRKLGNGSKSVGRATFVIEDPIHAEDPERLLWKPNGGDQVATATGG